MKKKLFSLLMAMAMVLSLAIPAFASEGDDLVIAPAPSMSDSIVILHTNDVHGAVESYAKVAALKAQYEALGAYVLVMDAGDFSQGTTYVSTSLGATAVELMGLAGYDVAAPGNHEFDYGYEALKANAASAKFPE